MQATEAEQLRVVPLRDGTDYELTIEDLGFLRAASPDEFDRKLGLIIQWLSLEPSRRPTSPNSARTSFYHWLSHRASDLSAWVYQAQMGIPIRKPDVRSKANPANDTQPASSPPAEPTQKADLWTNRATPNLVSLADIESKPISWLWHSRIPRGRLTMLVGRPGEGKSFLTAEIAARVTTGSNWPDGAPCESGSVLLMSAEDDPSDTIRPRLDASGADVRRVSLLRSGTRRSITKGDEEVHVGLGDLDMLDAALTRLPDCRLLIFDPIGSFLSRDTDGNSEGHVRSILGPIARLAEQYGVAVLLVAHRRKGGGNFADDLALGSRAFTGLCRATWHLQSDPKNLDRRLLLPGKSNLAKRSTGLAFTIEGEPARIQWEAGELDLHADQGIALEEQAASERRGRPGPEPTAQAEASEWLQEKLSTGPKRAIELTEDWVSGLGKSKRTLDRARSEMGVVAFRPQVPGPWWWTMPDNNAKSDGDHGTVGYLGDLGNVEETAGKAADMLGDQLNNANIARIEQPGELGSADQPPVDRPPPGEICPAEASETAPEGLFARTEMRSASRSERHPSAVSDL